jgi:hypothetical protein
VFVQTAPKTFQMVSPDGDDPVIYTWSAPDSDDSTSAGDQIDQLQRQLDELQKQLARAGKAVDHGTNTQPQAGFYRQRFVLPSQGGFMPMTPTAPSIGSTVTVAPPAGAVILNPAGPPTVWSSNSAPMVARVGPHAGQVPPMPPMPPTAAPPPPHARERGHGGAMGESSSGPRAGATVNNGGDADVEVRSYHLPKGKLEALGQLMLRDDVPVRVRLGDGQIDVYGPPEQQRIIEQFIHAIDPHDGAPGSAHAGPAGRGGLGGGHASANGSADVQVEVSVGDGGSANSSASTARQQHARMNDELRAEARKAAAEAEKQARQSTREAMAAAREAESAARAAGAVQVRRSHADVPQIELKTLQQAVKELQERIEELQMRQNQHGVSSNDRDLNAEIEVMDEPSDSDNDNDQDSDNDDGGSAMGHVFHYLHDALFSLAQ